MSWWTWPLKFALLDQWIFKKFLAHPVPSFLTIMKIIFQICGENMVQNFENNSNDRCIMFLLRYRNLNEMIWQSITEASFYTYIKDS